MENLKYAGKFCILVFVLGMLVVAGNRVMEFVWPKQHEKILIVHYLCTENDDGDVSCGRIKDIDIANKLSEVD